MEFEPKINVIKTYLDSQLACLGKQVVDASVTNIMEAQPGVNIYSDEDGEPWLATIELNDVDELVQTIRSHKMHKTTSKGLPVEIRPFGFVPGINEGEETRGEERVEEKLKGLLYDMARRVEGYYREIFLKNYMYHADCVEKIPLQFRINGGIFTNGIINSSNELVHHFDEGSYIDKAQKLSACTCCLLLEDGTTAGELHIPGINIALKPRGNHLVIFKGGELIHGVSKVNKTTQDSYRYSVVYYTLKSMEHGS